MTTHNFGGKVALVTGGAAGIGRASALAFARNGAKVVVADVQTAGGEETVAQIKSAGGEAAFIRADVSMGKEVAALIRRTVALYGRLNFAHNNAGVEGTRARAAAAAEEDWDRTIAINLKGVWLCMKYEIPEMLKLGQAPSSTRRQSLATSAWNVLRLTRPANMASSALRNQPPLITGTVSGSTPCVLDLSTLGWLNVVWAARRKAVRFLADCFRAYGSASAGPC